jgi:hypothetical protein
MRHESGDSKERISGGAEKLSNRALKNTRGWEDFRF